MLVSKSTFRGFGLQSCPTEGSWETWCECAYGPGAGLGSLGADLLAKCLSKPFPFGVMFPPWTIAGGNARGLPEGHSVEKAKQQLETARTQQTAITDSYAKAAADIRASDADRIALLKKVGIGVGLTVGAVAIVSLLAKALKPREE